MPTSPLDRDAKGDDRAPGVSRSSPTASGRYLPGAVLSSKYRLEDLLGEGGMGSVWRATNLLLELPVAIKLIRADLDRGALRARLQLEARSAAKLGHPAIVRVYDVGESELGDPFIVMELLQGETLARMLTRGRLSGAQAVQLLLPIIDALGTAHARGIVHRDLKPDNLMIALEEQHIQPKILDFGIAKVIDPKASDHKLTEAGAVVGSPDYMSPEQARGREDLDASTDIWSLCVVLYEAVTGSAPFTASNYHALLRAIVEDQPRSIVERAAGDEALWVIISRGLAKDRRLRYQSMPELGQALATWLLGHGVREDAAGTSIESKWLAKSSDPSSLGPRSAAAPVPNADFRSQVTQDSHPGATGVGRGPFTRTILPRATHRKRVLGALALVALASATLALLLRRAPNAGEHTALRGAEDANRTSIVRAPEPRLPSTADAPSPSASPALSPSATPAATVTSARASSALDHATLVEPAQPNGLGHRPLIAPGAATAGSHRSKGSAGNIPAPGVPAPSAAVPKPSPGVTAPSASAKLRDRPLDLLAPY